MNEWKITHGHAKRGHETPEYRAYCGAKTRCMTVGSQFWSRYGGRGIEFRFASFGQFLAELGLRPTPQHSLDRIKNDGHYEPGNVRWATRSEQQINRRVSNPSGYRGIRFRSQYGKWNAAIGYQCKKIHLGTFDTAVAAAHAYDAAARTMYGDSALVNFTTTIQEKP